ncbi:MAG: TlpA family protein disulfide reductase [Clostridiales bacterium]|nr:TlpA family protein disulfide reductase [Clostridiales bacterium]
MSKIGYIKILAIFLAISSIFIFSGCQKSSNDNGKKGSETSDNVQRISSEEALKDLKITLVDGQDYANINVDMIDFELKDLNGDNIKLSDYSGRVVILNFWATWCPPCKVEMPFMQQIHEKYNDVAILAVNSTATELRGGSDSKKAKKQVQKLIDSEGYTFSVPLDAENEVAALYSGIFPMRGIPTNFIIDKEGVIRYVSFGAFMSVDHMEQMIKLAQD